MKNQTFITVIAIFGLGFLCGILTPSCDSNKSELNPIDTSVVVNTTVELRDTAVAITHEPVKAKLKFKPVVVRRSQIGNETTKDTSITASAESDRDSATVFVCDTILKQDEVKLTSPTPIPLGLWFEFLPKTDTVHLFNKDIYTTKTITIEVERKRPWYEVPGYVGIGVLVGTVVGILARGSR